MMAMRGGARKLLLGLCLGCRAPLSPVRSVAAQGIQDMMKDIGATELTDDMLKPAREQEEADRKAMDAYKDPVAMLKKGGLDVSDAKAAEMRQSPEKVREAMDETVAQATQLEMYKQVACDACKAIAQVLAYDLNEKWKPTWSDEKLLSHIQAFCESGALPGDVQVVAERRKEGQALDTYKVEKNMGNVRLPTTNHSEQVLRRACREDVDEQDTRLASMARAQGLNKNDPWAKLRQQGADVQKAYALGDFLAKALEPAMCSRRCRSRAKGQGEKTKKSKGRGQGKDEL